MATKPTSKKLTLKRLTLEQAIEATRNPIKREGDLVFVQKDPRFENLYSGMTDLAGNEFPAGEMRSVYMPSMDRSIREFDRPATENQLRTLYAEGGYLESLERFTDEALAMYYGYMAGTVTESGLAGNVGDPGQFEADVQEALSRRPEVRPDDLRVIQQDILALHKKYKLSANKGGKFVESRRTGAKAKTTIYIENLNSRYPKATARELYQEALGEAGSSNSPFSKDPFSEEDDELWDKSKDKVFPFSKFKNRLSEIRNPKTKNPGTR